MKIRLYLIHEILLSTSAFYIVFYIILSGNYFADFLFKAVDGYIGLKTVLKLLYFISPSIILLILPISVYAGVYTTFKQLAAKNELIAISSFGISWRKIFIDTLIPIIPLTALTLILSFIIGPKFSAYFETQIKNATNQSIQYLQPGTFYNINNNEILLKNNKKAEKKEFFSVSFKENEISIIYSPDSLIRKIDNHSFLSLNQGWEDTLNTKNKSIKELNFKDELIDLDSKKITPDLTLSSMSSEKLFRKSDLKSKIELRWRLFTGFLPLIALFFVFPFCQNFIKSDSHFNTILAIVCFFAFCIISSVIKNMLSAGKLPYWVGFEIPVIIILIISISSIFSKNRR